MRHLGGAITRMVATLRQRGRPQVTPPVQTLLDFGLSFLRPMAYDYLDWQDPLPAIRAATDFTRGAVRRLVSRVRKNASWGPPFTWGLSGPGPVPPPPPPDPPGPSTAVCPSGARVRSWASSVHPS